MLAVLKNLSLVRKLFLNVGVWLRERHSPENGGLGVLSRKCWEICVLYVAFSVGNFLNSRTGFHELERRHYGGVLLTDLTGRPVVQTDIATTFQRFPLSTLMYMSLSLSCEKSVDFQKNTRKILPFFQNTTFLCVLSVGYDCTWYAVYMGCIWYIAKLRRYKVTRNI